MTYPVQKSTQVLNSSLTEKSSTSIQGEDKYIIPTKENPVFKVYCHAYGTYLDGMYKDYTYQSSDGYTVLCNTYALNLPDALRYLFDFIKENPETDKGFEVYMVDGSHDKKRNDIKEKLVFKLRPGEAKKCKVIL